MSSSGEEPLIKKRKKSSQPVLAHIPTLPDDLLVSCFAQVSRLYYPSLSLVSKSFRSLLASPELYKTRSMLGRTESCLYVSLQFPTDPKPRWFTLCRRPNKTLTNKKKKKKSSGYVFAEISKPESPNAHWSGVVGIGSNIYCIGGSMHKSISSSVSILDCLSQTWHEAPSMRVMRNYAPVSVLDGKIYVVGGNKECNSSNWMEVFDPRTQTWELVLSPRMEICGSSQFKSVGIEEKVYMWGLKSLAYEPKKGRWEMVGSEMYGYSWCSYCVINNVLYCHIKHSREFKWFDTKVRSWKILKGLIKLPKFSRYACVKLVDYGGKMVFLWDKYMRSSEYEEKMIWCAEIALEKRNNEDIWGIVEWCDAVLKVPKSYKFEYALATTV